MLSLAYLWDGDEDNYFKRLRGLEDLPAHQFEDYLLKGWAEATWLPQRAKANLKVARDKRPTSHVAVLLYAQALRRNALELPNPHQGLDEARQAMSMLQSLKCTSPIIR